MQMDVKPPASGSERPRESLLARLHRALGPLAGGLILDFVDIATFGPVGILGGFLVGALAGWWVSSIYEFSPRSRVLLAVLAAVYTAVPLTEPLPLATAISALARFRERPRRSGDNDCDNPESPQR